jgi:RNA polymerase sigma-70 factor (ECF subfamily)
MDRPDAARISAFEPLRRRLFGIAYRMLGSAEDAEDLVQETYLRWHESDASRVESSEAWLVSVITRLAIDRARRAAIERAHYVGHWLPEPVATDERLGAERKLEEGDELSIAFLLLLERLSAHERAAFVLREVFDYDYPLISGAVEKTEAATRQMVHRARERLSLNAAKRPEKVASGALVQRFLAALAHGDQQGILEVLSPDVRLISDSGGKVAAARNVIVGPERLARFFLGVRNKYTFAREHEPLEQNGAAGWISVHAGRVLASTVVESNGDHITALFRVLNPDKLKTVAVGLSSAIAL